MLSKEQHIQFWQRQVEDDAEAMTILFAKKKYVQSLFWAHLVAEKLAKALWIQHNAENVPPKTHNIAMLIARTPLNPPEEMVELMLFANRFNLEGRYPEYIENLKMLSTASFAKESHEKINILIQWLKQHLP
ncbi:MAG: HEPN domain-containing protein [Saprospiraceae bacterium]